MTASKVSKKRRPVVPPDASVQDLVGLVIEAVGGLPADGRHWGLPIHETVTSFDFHDQSRPTLQRELFNSGLSNAVGDRLAQHRRKVEREARQNGIVLHSKSAQDIKDEINATVKVMDGLMDASFGFLHALYSDRDGTQKPLMEFDVDGLEYCRQRALNQARGHAVKAAYFTDLKAALVEHHKKYVRELPVELLFKFASLGPKLTAEEAMVQ